MSDWLRLLIWTLRECEIIHACRTSLPNLDPLTLRHWFALHGFDRPNFGVTRRSGDWHNRSGSENIWSEFSERTRKVRPCLCVLLSFVG